MLLVYTSCFFVCFTCLLVFGTKMPNDLIREELLILRVFFRTSNTEGFALHPALDLSHNWQVHFLHIDSRFTSPTGGTGDFSVIHAKISTVSLFSRASYCSSSS